MVRELAARGHQIHLTADAPETLGGHGLVERLAAEYPDRVTIRFAPGVDTWRWTPVASGKGEGGTTVIAFKPIDAKFVKITQTATGTRFLNGF